MSHCSGFVLVGGKSTRMGRDKATLLFGGKPFLQHAVEIARGAADFVCLVGSEDALRTAAEKYGFPIIADTFPGTGPLGGIHAALVSPVALEWNLVLAVDTPFITQELVRYLRERAAAFAGCAVLPRAAGRLQPLCGMYRQSFAAQARKALECGRYKIEDALASEAFEVASEEELSAHGFHAEMFANINTPQELEDACRSFGGARSHNRPG